MSRSRTASRNKIHKRLYHFSSHLERLMCQHVSKYAASLYTFRRKCILRTGNVITPTNPARTAQISIVFSPQELPFPLQTTSLLHTTSYILLVTKIGLRTGFPYISTTDGSESCKHAGLFSRPAGLHGSAGWTQAFVSAQVPAQVWNTKLFCLRKPVHQVLHPFH